MKTTLNIVKNINLIICALYVATLLIFNIAYGLHFKPINFAEKQITSLIYFGLVVGVLLELILQTRHVRRLEKEIQVSGDAFKELTRVSLENIRILCSRIAVKNKTIENLKQQIRELTTTVIGNDFASGGVVLGKPTIVKMAEDAEKLGKLSEKGKTVLAFSKSVFTDENIKLYGFDMLMQFFNYWADVVKTKRGAKMRCQTKPNFTLKNKLKVWQAEEKQKSNDNETISK